MTQLSGAVGDEEGQVTAAAPSPQSLAHPNDNAPDHAESMSGPDLSEAAPQAQSSSPGATGHDARPTAHLEDWDTPRPLSRTRRRFTSISREDMAPVDIPNREIPFAHMRVHFEDFANQLRLHRHHEHRKRILLHRQRHLQKAVALSARLHRVGSWVHDGLVEISRQSDTSGFTRVHQHLQDLVDSCFSQWNHEIHALDPTYTPQIPVKNSFLAKLTMSSQEDFLEFIQTLRSNPGFLVERFKAMSPAQISALSTSPKFQELSESVLTSLSQNRGRSSQKKRIRAYSKELEDYASSFERSNPLSFLLYNIYGSLPDMISNESQLRLSTWSTICSALMLESEQAFHAIIGQVLGAFANMYEWPIKDRLELFLMSVLQRGAYLLDLVDNPATIAQSEMGLFDPFSTQQAQEFFDGAVKELFEILACDGGIPSGALHLGRVMIAKLSTVDIQSQFRGHFFFQWFLRDHLRVSIEYPEDEKMLHQFHVGDKARSHLLHKLWNRAFARASDVFSPMPAQPIDPDIQTCVLAMINQLDADNQCIDPYKAMKSQCIAPNMSPESFLSICAADIAHALEALSPQFIHTSSPWDSFLSSSHSTFSMQYGRASSKFDKLRSRILDVIEPGQSSKSIHPCQESWASLSISSKGDLTAPTMDWADGTSIGAEGLGELDLAEEAACRLVEGSISGEDRQGSRLIPISSARVASLPELFMAEARMAQIKTDSIASMYWQNASSYLQHHYPLTILTKDDTKVLGPLTEKFRARQLQLGHDGFQIEQQVTQLEASYNLARLETSRLSAWLDKLRIKLWYKMDVVSSNAYEDANNISTALNNMAISALKGVAVGHLSAGSEGRSRPSTSGTSASSILEQPRIDAMSILKAPAEHGGPKKLSDPQIEMTKKWLERNHIDNFCKGEERIHRFCMEVKIATRNLVGETLSESPVLWSSELFTRERNLYDIHGGMMMSAQPSTRSPSVWSEPVSSSSLLSRSGFAGLRTSLYSQSSGKLGRDLPGSDLASIISSPGRATTVTTLESEGSFWSPAQSNSRSVTSASLQSRPGSTFGDLGLNRLTDHSQEKASFLESLQQSLTCLLLSDLGCPVWSCGSETDAWMVTMRHTASIVGRLEQRAVMARLLSKADPRNTTELLKAQTKKTRRHRSRSMDTANPRRLPQGSMTVADPIEALLVNDTESLKPGSFSYLSAFNDVLSRISEHVEPNLKLKAVYDFKTLSQAFERDHHGLLTVAENAKQATPSITESAPRRRSLNPEAFMADLGGREGDTKTISGNASNAIANESDVVRFLKRLLFVLQPKTIFRDLQYIAAFVSAHTLGNTERGRAFLHVGLAALAWKDEVCRGMVDVADRIVAKDSIKSEARRGEGNEASVLKAAEYWVIAAREGNAIAQRELASLYLTHAQVPPIVSLPLALSSEIFKNDMMWEEQEGSRTSSQALCLALHWMQLAAENGDTVAQTKLKERRASRSVR